MVNGGSGLSGPAGDAVSINFRRSVSTYSKTRYSDGLPFLCKCSTLNNLWQQQRGKKKLVSSYALSSPSLPHCFATTPTIEPNARRTLTCPNLNPENEFRTSTTQCGFIERKPENGWITGRSRCSSTAFVGGRLRAAWWRECLRRRSRAWFSSAPPDTLFSCPAPCTPSRTSPRRSSLASHSSPSLIPRPLPLT
jgi:hypothetical protein